MRKTLSIIGIVLGLCCLAVLANTDHKKSEGNSSWFPEIMNYFSKEQEIMLNERQKKILEMELLPTEYEELTTIQRRGIKAIEEFMCYLDEAFPDETFEFIGYNFAHEDRNEQLRAECSIGEITVYRQKQHGKWVYLDTYAARCEAIQFTETFKKELNQEFGEGNWLLKFCEYYFPKDAFAEGLEGRCSFNYTVYLKQSATDSPKSSVENISEKLAKHTNYEYMRILFEIFTVEDYAASEFSMGGRVGHVSCMIYENRRIYIHLSVTRDGSD